MIDPALCTECVGHHDEPQCVEVCPVECIIVDPEHAESREQLDLQIPTPDGEGVRGMKRFPN